MKMVEKVKYAKSVCGKSCIEIHHLAEACYNLCMTQFFNRAATEDRNESFMCTFQLFFFSVMFPRFLQIIHPYIMYTCVYVIIV